MTTVLCGKPHPNHGTRTYQDFVCEEPAGHGPIRHPKYDEAKGITATFDHRGHGLWWNDQEVEVEIRVTVHNHRTRDIKPKGQCPACDETIDAMLAEAPPVSPEQRARLVRLLTAD